MERGRRRGRLEQDASSAVTVLDYTSCRACGIRRKMSLRRSNVGLLLNFKDGAQMLVM